MEFFMGVFALGRGRAVLPILCSAFFATLLYACGGGGDDDSPSIVRVSPSAFVVPVGGTNNIVPITVKAGQFGGINLPLVSVTVCSPTNSALCQTIDNIILDTGSVGLRIMSAALSPTLALPYQVSGAGGGLVECGQFIDGYTWGAVRQATVRLAGEQAVSIPIQVIGDGAFPNVPAACSNTGRAQNTPQSLGANGILGLGLFPQDCGLACEQIAAVGLYYSCQTSIDCRQTTVPIDFQVKQPIVAFARHNNGIVLKLPAIGDGSPAVVEGALVLGVDTQSNNLLSGVTVLPVSRRTGNLNIVSGGVTYTESFLDSGSNAIYFPSSTVPRCRATIASSFYCPSSILTVPIVVQGINGLGVSSSFSITNATQLFLNYPKGAASAQLGAPTGSINSINLGLPFFYGRNVYSVMIDKTTSAGAGPYVAF